MLLPYSTVSGALLIVWSVAFSFCGVEASSFQRAAITSSIIQPRRHRRSSSNHHGSPSFFHRAGRRRAVQSSTCGWESDVLLVARRVKTAAKEVVSTSEPPQTESQALDTIKSYDDLSFPGKIIAGVVELVVVVAIDYAGGFASGYAIGSLCGIPGLLFGKGQQDVASAARAGMFQAVSTRFAKMHQRSFRWGGTWGGVSAAVAGFGVAARVVRGGVEDEWTSVLSSMAMGAFFARKDGAMAMFRGAIMYGALVKLMSSGSAKKRPIDYQEEKVIDF